MAGDQIREYVIKIRAEVKEALAQIDQLKGKFDKVELKTNIDKSFGQQIEKLSGSIGKITQEMGELKTSFKDVDFKSFTGDMKQSFDELKTSIDDIKNSAKTLADTFDFSGKQSNGFKDFVTDLQKQISDLTTKYQESVQQIQNMTTQGFVPRGAATPSGQNFVANSIAQQSEQIQIAAQNGAKNITDSAKLLKEAEAEALEIISSIKSTMDELDVSSVANIYTSSFGEEGDYLAVADNIKRLQGLLKQIGRSSSKVNAAMKTIGGEYSVTTLGGIRKSLLDEVKNRRQDTFKDEAAVRKKQRSETLSNVAPEEMRVVLNYDITANDDPEEIRTKAQAIVEKIQNEVQSVVQEQINKNPIRIPISFGSYELLNKSDEGKDSLSDQAHGKGVIKDLHVAIKAHTDGLIDDINSKITKLNEQITSTIDVKIRPILPKEIDIASKVGELESKAADQIEQGINLNLPNVSFSGSDDCCQQVANILGDIRGIVTEISGKMDFPKPPTTPPHTPTSPLPTTPISQPEQRTLTYIPSDFSEPSITNTHQNGTPTVSVNTTIQSDRIEMVTQGDTNANAKDVVIHDINDSMITSEIGAFGDTGESGIRRRKENHFLTKQFPYMLASGRKLTGIAAGRASANERNEIDLGVRGRFWEGLTQFQKDIATRKSVEEMHKQPYYTESHSYNGKEWAHYGQPGAGELLPDFQARIDKIFELGTSLITKYSNSLHDEIIREQSDPQLVDSGVDGYKVPKWMKRIIDRDFYQEKYDTQDSYLKKRIKKEAEEGNSKFVESGRNKLIQQTQTEIANLQNEKARLLDLDKPYRAIKGQQIDLQNAIQSVSKMKTAEDFKSWYGSLRFDDVTKATITKDIASWISSTGDGFAESKESIADLLSEALTKVSSEVDKLQDSHEKYTEKLVSVEDQIRTREHQVGQYKNASDIEIAREIVRNEHSEARKLLASDKAGLTEERKDQLAQIEEKTIKSFAERASKAIIRGSQTTTNDKDIDDFLSIIRGQLSITEDNNDLISGFLKEFKEDSEYKPFGRESLKEPTSKVISRAEVRNPSSIKLLDTMERNGYAQDEETGNWIAIKGINRTAKTNKEATEDVFETVRLIGEDGERRFNEQRAITDLLAANENRFKEYISSFELAVSGGESISESEIQNMADFLYAQIPEDVKDEFAVIKQQLLQKISTERGKLKNGGKDRDDMSFLSDQEREIFSFANQLEGGLTQESAQDLYDFARSWVDALTESRRRENEINKNTQETMEKIIDSNMKRRIDEKTYVANKQRLLDAGNIVADYERRMTKTPTGKTVIKKDGRTKQIMASTDPSSITEFERRRYYKAKQDYDDILKEQIGYEIAHGIRDYRGNLIEKGRVDQLYGKNSRVTNLGLSLEMQSKYAHTPPNPIAISKPLLDENGFQTMQDGQYLREAVGYTSDQLREFATVLRSANAQISEELARLPHSEEEINEKVQSMVAKDIDSIRTERNKLVSTLAQKFTEYKNEYAEDFSPGNREAELVRRAQFNQRNIDTINKIKLANTGIKELNTDQPIGDYAKLVDNESEIQALKARQDQISDALIAYLENGDETVSQDIINKLNDVQNLRMAEKEAKVELDDYVSTHSTSIQTLFGGDSVLKQLLNMINEAEAANDTEELDKLRKLIQIRKEALINDAFTNNGKQNISDLEVFNRKEYLEGIRSDRKKAEQDLMRLFPLSQFYDTETGALGQDQFTSPMGRAIQELLTILNRLDELNGENLRLSQILQENADVGTTRAKREKTYREALQGRRNELSSIVAHNELNAQAYDRMAQNEPIIQGRNAKLLAKKEEQKKQQEQKRIQKKEIDEEANLSAEQLLSTIEQDRVKATGELKSEVEKMRQNLDQEKTSIVETSKRLNESLASDIDEKEKIIEQARQRLSDEQRELAALRNEGRRPSDSRLKSIQDRKNELAIAEKDLAIVKGNAELYSKAVEIITNNTEEEKRLNNEINSALTADDKDRARQNLAKYHTTIHSNPIASGYLQRETELHKAEYGLRQEEQRFNQRTALARSIGSAESDEARNKAIGQYIKYMYGQIGIEEDTYDEQTDSNKQIVDAKNRQALAASKRAEYEEQLAAEEKRRNERIEREREIRGAERAGYIQAQQKKQTDSVKLPLPASSPIPAPIPSPVSSPNHVDDYDAIQDDIDDYDQLLKVFSDHQEDIAQSTKSIEHLTQSETNQSQASVQLASSSTAAASSVQNLSDKVIEFADAKSKINEKEPSKQEQKTASPQKTLANKSQKLESPKITKDGIDFNGKHYSLLPENQRIDTKSSKGLKEVYDAASKRGRTSWTPKNAVKYLDAYSMTGNQDFILGLEASMQKGQKTAALKTEYKNEIKKFILKQLISDIDPGEYKDQLNSEYTKLANQMMKKGSKLQPSEANQLIRQHLAQLQGTTLPSQPTSPVADTSGTQKQIDKANELAEAATRAENAIEKMGQASGNETPVSSTTSTEQKTDIQPAIEQQNQLQAELSETTAKAQEASGAINSLNDSMITFETDATNGAKLSSEKLPVLSDNGRVLGASKRNNIPYSIEEFENNQGLAEKVLAANGPKFNTDYWAQSKANAQEYINTVKEAAVVTQQVQGQLQDNSKAVDSSSAQAEASRSSADSMANEAAAAKEAESALLAKAAAEQQAAESSRQLAQASQQSADTAKLQVEAPKVVPQASVEKQTKTTVKMSQPQLPGDTTTLPGAETESGSFSGLVTTLTETIPQAVKTKNEAFEQELSLVQDVASQEAQAFDQLINKLEKIAGLATNFKFDFSIQGGEQFNDDFLTNFGKLKTEVDGIDPTKFTAIGNAFSGIGKSLTNKKDLSQYFMDLGTAIKTFSESMNTIDISDNFSSISNMIDKIANAGSALKNALTLMKEQKSSYDYKYGTDQETNQQVKDLLKQAQYLSTPNNVSKAAKYGMQYAQFNAGDTSKALTTEQYTWWEDYKRQSADFENSFSSLQSSLKLTADGYDALSDAMNRFNDNKQSALQGMAIEEQKTKDFSNQLRGMQERINQIPEEEKQAYAGAVGRLQNRFDEASQGLSSGKIVWQEYTEQMKAAWKEYERFKKANPTGSIQLMSGVTGSSEDVMKQIQSTLSQRYKLVTQNVSGGAIDSNGMARFSAQVVDADNNVQNLKITWDTFNNTVSATANTASEQFKGRFMSLITDLQAKSKQLFVYWTATFMNPYRLIGVGKQAISIIKELDSAMTELKKVSSESAESYANFQTKSFDMANEVGTTAKQIIQSTADWKRLGKSFEDAQKLAQQSTVLMNVSEFQNIDDATNAMVSATQAYSDTTSEAIIDKLNYVGNNFAVGTSELAQGLQNAAAVLKTQGNDIDEALALLTAGNLIGQDMSKASAGIRMISLRISGTEEAKNEIADMGEDVDDFVVRTKSKTDQIIRDYTAVASNAYQGVSVLDNNGNLRDTYSILLDISKIYKEIQDEDKKAGTNRAQALVETLGGKNRSNIASSILLNGDILEQVYNASKNESTGSAQKELNTYLDSVEGKTTQITNNLQQLATATIDTDSFKTFLDLINSILTGVNSLAEAFGGLNLAISAIAGIQLQKHGLGKHNCFPESQLVNKMPFLLQRIIMPCVCK